MNYIFSLANTADFDEVEEADVTQPLQSHGEDLNQWRFEATRDEKKQLEMIFNCLFKII